MASNIASVAHDSNHLALVKLGGSSKTDTLEVTLYIDPSETENKMAGGKLFLSESQSWLAFR